MHYTTIRVREKLKNKISGSDQTRMRTAPIRGAPRIRPDQNHLGSRLNRTRNSVQPVGAPRPQMGAPRPAADPNPNT
jgi:hypothetical protein